MVVQCGRCCRTHASAGGGTWISSLSAPRGGRTSGCFRSQPSTWRMRIRTRRHQFAWPIARELGYTRDTRAHTGAHGHTDHTDEPQSSQPCSKPNDTPHDHVTAETAADSEEAAPSEPDPTSTHSQSASPRLLEGGARRNEHGYRYLFWYREPTSVEANASLRGVWYVPHTYKSKTCYRPATRADLKTLMSDHRSHLSV